MSEASIVLSAVDNTKAAFDSVKGGLQGLHTNATMVVGSLGALGAAGAVLAFAGTIRSAIDAADAINKLSQRTGIAAEALSQLQFAAKLSDVSADALNTMIKKLNISIAEAAGGDGKKAEMFKNLNVSLKDVAGNVLSADKVLLQIADTMSTAKDGANKVAYAYGLMGKSAEQGIPLLNAGGAAITDMMDKANKLGLTISTDFARQAETFNDNLKIVETSSQRLAISLASDLVEGLSKTAKAMADASVQGGKLAGIIAGIQTLFTGDDRHKANVSMVESYDQIAASEAALTKAQATNDTGRIARLTTRISGLKQEFETHKAYAASLDQQTAKAAAAEPKKTQNLPGIKGDSGTTAAAETAYARLNKELAKKLALEQTEIQYGGKLGEIRKYEAEILAKITGEGTKLTVGQKAQLQSKLELITAAQELNNLRDSEYKQAMEIAQARSAARNAEYEAGKQSLIQAMQDNSARHKVAADMLDSIEFETRALGMNAQQRELATALRELERQGIKQGTEAWDQYGEAIKKAIGDKAALSQDIERFSTLFGSIDSTAKSVFTNVFQSGSDSFKRLGQTLKSSLLDLLYQMTVKKWIFNIAASVSGASGGAISAVAQTALGGSGGDSVTSGLGSISGIYDAISGGFSKLSATATQYFSNFATSSVGQSLGLSSGTIGGAPAMTQAASTMATAAGSIASSVGGFIAGEALRKGISGGYSVSKGFDTFQQIGIAVGTALGGPVLGAITGAAAGVFNRAFGMAPKQAGDSGIRGTLGSTGVDLQNYSQWTQKGGWFRSDKSGTDTSAIGSELNQLLNGAVVSTTASTKAFAAALGQTSTAVDGFTQSINISLKGLDAKQQEAAIGKALGDFADGMAEKIIGTSKTVINEVEKQVTEMVTGWSAISGDYGNVTSELVTRNVKSSVSTSTYTPSEFAKTGETASQTLQRLAASLTTVNSTLEVLKMRLAEVSLSGADASSKLIDAMGGLDKFAAATGNFYENFYTDIEKRSQKTSDIAKSLNSAGVTTTSDQIAKMTRDQYRAMIESFGAVTAANAPMLAALYNNAAAFASITPASVAAAEAVEALSQTMLSLNANSAKLKVDLLRAQGNTTGADAAQRTLDTTGFSAAEVAVYDYNRALQAQIDTLNTATATATQVAQERAGLQTQLNALTDTQAQAQQRLRDAINPSNVVLYDMVQAAQAVKTAVAAAAEAIAAAAALALQNAEAVKSNLATVTGQYQSFIDALNTTGASTKAASQSITSGYLSALDAVTAAQEEIANATAQAGRDLLTLAGSIREFISGLDRSASGGLNERGQFAASQSDFAIALAQAKAGDKTATSQLTGLAGAMLTLGQSQSTSAVDYRMLVAQTKGQLGALAAATEAANAGANTDPQKQTLAAQERLLRAQMELTNWTKAVSESGASTDKQVTDYAADWRVANTAYRRALGDKNIADQMVQGLDLTLKTPLQDIADALNVLGLAMVADRGTQSASTMAQKAISKASAGASTESWLDTAAGKIWKSTGGAIGVGTSAGIDIHGKDASAFTDIQARQFVNDRLASNDLLGIYKKAIETGVSAASLDALMGWKPGTSNEEAMKQGLPKFANGGMHSGGWAVVGEQGPELAYMPPARIYTAGQTSSMMDTAELVAELKAVRAELAEIKASTQATASHTAKQARQTERVMPGGDAITVRVVA